MLLASLTPPVDIVTHTYGTLVNVVLITGCLGGITLLGVIAAVRSRRTGKLIDMVGGGLAVLCALSFAGMLLTLGAIHAQRAMDAVAAFNAGKGVPCHPIAVTYRHRGLLSTGAIVSSPDCPTVAVDDPGLSLASGGSITAITVDQKRFVCTGNDAARATGNSACVPADDPVE